MCGLAGGFWSNPSATLEQDMANALSIMRSRGPNHQGFDRYSIAGGELVLGHTRLSILDLSAAGQQPMYSNDRRYCVIFNGEIYNYIELKAELESQGDRFHTHSDTEVLLAAWKRWGAGSLSRFKGMFAFVMYDQMQNTLTCVRDAFGIKPFFYSSNPREFVFASELPALNALKTERPQLNWQRAYDYLVHGEYDFDPQSFIDGVVSLMPGHMLKIDLGTFKISDPIEWWRPSVQAREKLSFKDAAAALRERFLENIRLHLRSDVPVGAALSGGIDSSAIVCGMRYLEPGMPIETFSFIARDSDVSEEKWIDEINRHVGASSNKILVTASELQQDLDDLVAAQGEPFGSTSIYAQYRVFKNAREQGTTVVLEGQGADELLGGYNGYPGQRVRSLLDERRYFAAAGFLHRWSKWPGRSHVEGMKRVVGQYATGSLYQALRQVNGMSNTPDWIRPGPLRDAGVTMAFPAIAHPEDIPGRRMMSELACSVSRRGLLGLLRHGDRNSMRFSIESRVPFLTQDMAEFTLALPEEYLVSPQGETKHLMRAAMRGIVPDHVLDRRDKIGFATPEKEWLMGMADMIRGWLQEDLQLPFLDQKILCQHFEEVVSGKRAFTWQVWRWVNFCHWYKRML
jgi:asparagine synthase (glutamine-hydrolysing)